LNSPSSSNKSMFAKTFSLGICNWAATGCFQTHTIGYYLLSHNLYFFNGPTKEYTSSVPRNTQTAPTLLSQKTITIHSPLQTWRRAYAQDDTKESKKEIFQQPLNHWTWLIASQQITNNSSKSITLQVPKFTARTSGSWLCQQSRIQSWRWRETKYPNHLPKTTRDQIDLCSMGLQFWYQLLNTWI
jgi:hypothetical protein